MLFQTESGQMPPYMISNYVPPLMKYTHRKDNYKSQTLFSSAFLAHFQYFEKLKGGV